jgi:hypothetical protein
VRALAAAGRAMLGLFIDDSWSALAIGALLAAVSTAKSNDWIEGAELQVALVAGTILILLEAVQRGARSGNRR